MPEAYVRGRRLGYEVQPADYDKSNLTVVFIHGSGGDREDWRSQLDGLSHVAAVIALELPGHGASEPPGEKTVPDFSKWVVDFVESLGLEKVVLVGCSLGSAITQWIALYARRPWIKAIGLIGAGARLRVHPDFLQGLITNKDVARGKLAVFCLSNAPDQAIFDMVHDKYAKTPAELIHGDLSACDAFDEMEKVKSIDLATLIVVGEEDKLTPVKYSHFLNQAIPNSKLAILPKAGHLVMMEQPDQFNTVLADFLAELKD
jgi:pimeloyl-ACP methyl ester carboxylesterase